MRKIFVLIFILVSVFSVANNAEETFLQLRQEGIEGTRVQPVVTIMPDQRIYIGYWFDSIFMTNGMLFFGVSDQVDFHYPAKLYQLEMFEESYDEETNIFTRGFKSAGDSELIIAYMHYNDTARTGFIVTFEIHTMSYEGIIETWTVQQTHISEVEYDS